MSLPCILPQWPAPARVRAFTTVRHGAGTSAAPFDHFNLGNRYGADGDAADVVDANRRELVLRFGLPEEPRWLRQVHGVGALRFEGPGQAADGEPEADAAVTSTPGTVLAVLTADCLPVVLCARDGGEVAVAHAGWRGLAAGVLEATVGAMRCPPSQLLAWLGPAAGPEHYEVGVEVYDAFVAADWGSGAAFSCSRPDHWRVDLYALARRRLKRAGVPASAIHGGELCTISDPARFYSHRRDRRTGRMSTVAWIDG